MVENKSEKNGTNNHHQSSKFHLDRIALAFSNWVIRRLSRDPGTMLYRDWFFW
jgi:hypothetical protein